MLISVQGGTREIGRFRHRSIFVQNLMKDLGKIIKIYDVSEKFLFRNLF
jgi:hypothetical protein